MTHLENHGEFMLFYFDGKHRQIGYRAYLANGNMMEVPFGLRGIEAYFEDGTQIWINSVQAMYINGADRIVLTYVQDDSTICMTAEDIRHLRIYVTDPRPFMTPAGKVLYGT